MNETLTLRQLSHVIGSFRETSADIPAATLQAFLIVAANPGISSKEVMQRANVTQSAVSRHLATLGEFSWKGGEGLNLITTIEDPKDRRAKISFLNERGRQLAMKFLRTMDPQGDEPDPSFVPTAADHMRAFRRNGAR